MSALDLICVGEAKWPGKFFQRDERLLISNSPAGVNTPRPGSLFDLPILHEPTRRQLPIAPLDRGLSQALEQQAATVRAPVTVSQLRQGLVEQPNSTELDCKFWPNRQRDRCPYRHPALASRTRDDDRQTAPKNVGLSSLVNDSNAERPRTLTMDSGARPGKTGVCLSTSDWSFDADFVDQVVASAAATAEPPGTTKKAGHKRSDPSPPPPVNVTEPDKKVWCTYWLRHGECDFMQQGCMYKHEMPNTEKLLELGFRATPTWWTERKASKGKGSARSRTNKSQTLTPGRGRQTGGAHEAESDVGSKTSGRLSSSTGDSLEGKLRSSQAKATAAANISRERTSPIAVLKSEKGRTSTSSKPRERSSSPELKGAGGRRRKAKPRKTQTKSQVKSASTRDTNSREPPMGDLIEFSSSGESPIPPIRSSQGSPQAIDAPSAQREEEGNSPSSKHSPLSPMKPSVREDRASSEKSSSRSTDSASPRRLPDTLEDVSRAKLQYNHYFPPPALERLSPPSKTSPGLSNHGAPTSTRTANGKAHVGASASTGLQSSRFATEPSVPLCPPCLPEKSRRYRSDVSAQSKGGLKRRSG